jgi:hypothetical protein
MVGIDKILVPFCENGDVGSKASFWLENGARIS